MFEKGDCFGFYGGKKNSECAKCKASARCKAILFSHGGEVVAEAIETLFEALQERNPKEVNTASGAKTKTKSGEVYAERLPRWVIKETLLERS